jgi:hypothetical protein
VERPSVCARVAWAGSKGQLSPGALALREWAERLQLSPFRCLPWR